jgi:regulator of sirC expression with transglutaminase-like and TPR domain
MAAEEPDAGPRTTADILAAGRSAERNSEWRLAAESYEQALRVMPRDATDAAAVRLDLARIYLRRLQSPELGMQQLRTFLQTWPQDPAAASVREELCRLAAARNLTESLCD